jgi:hypothetical protein
MSNMSHREVIKMTLLCHNDRVALIDVRYPLMHQAMKMASTKTHIPTNLQMLELFSAFCERLTYSKCWLRFCPRTYIILKSRVDRSELRDNAIERLDKILMSCKKHVGSESFQNTLDEYRFEQILRTFYSHSLCNSEGTSGAIFS